MFRLFRDGDAILLAQDQSVGHSTAKCREQKRRGQVQPLAFRHQKAAGARRKDRCQDRFAGRKQRLGFCTQRLGHLFVDDELCDGKTRTAEGWGQISAGFAAMRIKQGSGFARGEDRLGKGRGVGICGGGAVAGFAGDERRAIADTPGMRGKGSGRDTAERLDRRLGGEDHAGERPGWQGRGKELRHQKGRQRQFQVRAKPSRKVACKTLGLGGGTGDQDRGKRVVLSVHGHGVTCGCILWQPARMGPLTFLGIESSCDDTAAAVVRHVPGNAAQILSSVVEGQTALHAAFGGVVPEIAARAHAERLDGCVERALAAAGLRLADLDGVAVTAGPGLIGGVVSGVMLAKGICAATGLPLVGVNHLAGHALTPRLTDGLAFPYLMLLVSGGHCQFLIVRGVDDYTRIGGSIDDAPGEAFDKVAKALGLAQPGGPAVEAEALQGDAARFALPRPLLDRVGCDLSFSGLKTAVMRTRNTLVAKQGGITVQDRRDICAGFQAAVTDVLAEKTRRALAVMGGDAPVIAVAGGVAANQVIRARLHAVARAAGARFLAPPMALCTDNAAMIAWAGIERFRLGHRDGLDLSARPRWPLDSDAPSLIGSGRKGAKA